MKPLRFDSLDGLRGIAAFVVLLLHIVPKDAYDIVPRGFLAVDFFFVLSGFVIASAYDLRLLQELSLAKFAKLRLIRLYPLIILGILFGVIGYIKLYSPSMIVLMSITGLFLIPTPFGAASEGNPAIALNPPSWSLFWELVANIVYAVFRPILSDTILITMILISAFGLVLAGWSCGTLDIGAAWWSFWGGLPRVSFSFFLGILLLRARRHDMALRFVIGFLPGALLLAIILMAPVPAWADLPVQLGCVLFVFPILVVGCANAELGRLAPACALLGATSYPAYVLQSGIMPHLRGLPAHFHLGPAAATMMGVLASVAFFFFAWIALKIYDEPVRRRLARLSGVGRTTTPASTAP